MTLLTDDTRAELDALMRDPAFRRAAYRLQAQETRDIHAKHGRDGHDGYTSRTRRPRQEAS